MEKILIVATGGTFDKQYDEIAGELNFSNSHLPMIMKQVRCTVEYRITYLTLKDSLFMDDGDRQRLFDTCVKAAEQRIVVVHGTDTMTVSAGFLDHPPLHEKTIVFTGAMVPYTVSGSDALFNLGSAFTAVQLLDSGVYVCMNGKLFSSSSVRKNRSRGVFEEA